MLPGYRIVKGQWGGLEVEVHMPLASVDEHNRRKREERKQREEAAAKTGVACPKCGGELLWSGGPSPFSSQMEWHMRATRCASCHPCKITVELEK